MVVPAADLRGERVGLTAIKHTFEHVHTVLCIKMTSLQLSGSNPSVLGLPRGAWILQ
jgi:hypothetical protein